ncbi:MAG: BtrH N-terminal domain-containing protein [bacterium]
MTINFHHLQSAHCETGVTANLLQHSGLDIDEPLAFGIGAGLFFAYLPFIRLDGIPLTTFRVMPGSIFNRVASMLKVRVRVRRFRNQEKAMTALDQALEENIPVGLQVGVYWLPFFPDALRFHFNGHNIIVYGKEKGEYLISDPTLDHPVTISPRSLQKARFARGAFAPQGKMYYITGCSTQPHHIARAVVKGIRRTCFMMLMSPPPLGGVYGIRYLARQIPSWPEKLGDRKAILYLAQVIRMQEEIGTGGAGFRFIFGAFLQKAADVLPAQAEFLLKMSGEMTETGDRWREFALLASRICKERAGKNDTLTVASDILLDCADREKAIFQELRKNITTRLLKNHHG